MCAAARARSGLCKTDRSAAATPALSPWAQHATMRGDFICSARLGIFSSDRADAPAGLLSPDASLRGTKPVTNVATPRKRDERRAGVEKSPAEFDYFSMTRSSMQNRFRGHPIGLRKPRRREDFIDLSPVSATTASMLVPPRFKRPSRRAIVDCVNGFALAATIFSMRSLR